MVPSRSPAEYKRQLGRRGEDLATAYLRQQGYVILARNWRCPVGEIDIVAREGEILAFVEVRTRRGDRFGTPEESITRQAETPQPDSECSLEPARWLTNALQPSGKRGKMPHSNLVQTSA
jgi:hypothetical protein